MGKKVALLGFIVLLLVGIPITIYFLQKQQNVTSQAQKSTTLSFSPGTVTHNPGESFSSDININPGTNLVSFVKLDITWDANQLDISGPEAFVKNGAAFPQTLEGPVVQPGHLAVTLSIGSDPTAAIQAITKVGTITFTVKSTATSGSTNISFSSNTQVFSLGSNDSANENVLSSADPLQVTVAGATAPTNTPTPTQGTTAPTNTPTPTLPAPTATRTPTPSPTQPIGGGNPTATPTRTPTPSPTQAVSNPTATPTGTSSAGGNTAPACTSLSLDRSTTGKAPYSVTFSVAGNDTDGTVSKVSIVFGDGQTGQITSGGGIGTKTVTNAQISHTYQNVGTYNATATLTDNNLGTSGATSVCAKTITVNTTGLASAGTGGTGGTATTTGTTPTPTLAATGPGTVFVSIGAILGVISLIGGILFFVL